MQEDYTIQFYKKDYVGNSTPLTGSGETLSIKSFNSDDDRFAPILSKEAQISINVEESNNLSIVDFLAVEDDDWNIIVYKQPGDPAIFNGWLVVEDSSEPFLDPPIQLKLRISDGLPLLKNVPLKMSDGQDFSGLNNITDYVGHILYYINPDIAFRVYFDIFHTAMTVNNCPLAQTQIDAKTFEKDETTFEDCYTCLEKIMKDFKCRLFYENGFWHVVNMRQYTKTSFNWWQFSVVSDVVTFSASDTSEINVASVGKAQSIKLINKDAQVYYKVASKSVKETFNYQFPKEIVCNQALRTVTPIPSLDTATSKAFVLDCWIHQLHHVNPGPPHPVKVTYINREFDDFDYEKDKYIVLPREAIGAPGEVQLLSSEFYVDKGDTVSITVETRAVDTWAGDSTSVIFFVFLRGDDGTKWYAGIMGTLGHPDFGKLVWLPSTDNFADMSLAKSFTIPFEYKAEWTSYTIEPEVKIPVSGKVQIVLHDWTLFSPTLNKTWWKNLQVEYKPYIENSFRPVKSDFNFYEQGLKINKKTEDTVYLSDSPKRLIKGALFVNNLLATPEWFRLGITESLRFTQQMALLKYNFTFKQFRKIEGTLKGLSLNSNIPSGFLPQYSLTDIPNQDTLRYILTSITECNYLTGHWRGVLVEVQLNGPTTYDLQDFSYLFE